VVQGHCLVNDKLSHLIRDDDKSEPAKDNFGFDGHQDTPDFSADKANMKDLQSLWSRCKNPPRGR
jgi:hypothetical protein